MYVNAYICMYVCVHTYAYLHARIHYTRTCMCIHTHVALVQLLQYYTRESADTCVDALNLGKQSRLTADCKPLSGICNTCVVA
jgi:hypothetical protein